LAQGCRPGRYPKLGRFLGYTVRDGSLLSEAALDPFRKRGLVAIVHHMFGIFHGEVLIGRSKLEGGDPPMGVASGRFEPTDAFVPLRNATKPARDGTGKE
jgi:hypothetical protein